MQLPDKVQTAISILGKFDIPSNRVAPVLFQIFLRFRPQTPPPFWGASKGYWDFVALSTATLWGSFFTTLLIT